MAQRKTRQQEKPLGTNWTNLVLLTLNINQLFFFSSLPVKYGSNSPTLLIGCDLHPYTHGELWCATVYNLTLATAEGKNMPSMEKSLQCLFFPSLLVFKSIPALQLQRPRSCANFWPLPMCLPRLPLELLRAMCIRSFLLSSQLEGSCLVMESLRWIVWCRRLCEGFQNWDLNSPAATQG